MDLSLSMELYARYAFESMYVGCK